MNDRINNNMMTIQGVWEKLPASGQKPVIVLDCERLEREIVELEARLRVMRKSQKECIALCVDEIKRLWSSEEMAGSIFPDSIGLFDSKGAP